MRNILLAIGLMITLFGAQGAEDKFTYLGTYDNVRSTDTGHCYGTSILLWEMNDEKIIGLLNSDMGLCGDPPCSILNGKIVNGKLSFNTTVPVYEQLYSFEGNIEKTQITGLLNNAITSLTNSSFNQSYNNLNEWCSAWSKIQRCGGVKEYCK
jgi:hypothetical protein